MSEGDWSSHLSQGNALAAQGRYAEAVQSYQRGLSLRRDSPQLFSSLGDALVCIGDNAQAIAAYSQALALKADDAQTVANLSIALINNGELEQAIRCCKQAASLWPDILVFYRLLGVACRQAGELDESIEWYRRALARQPDAKIHSDLLFTLHFHPGYDSRRLYEEHAAWNRLYAKPLTARNRPHENPRTSDRRLHIGYVVFDLGDHPLGRFFLPLLENYDRTRFEVFCYCDFVRPDAIAARLRAQPGVVWRTIPGMADEQVAEMIRVDRIDIAVDLSMHSNNSRILMFALKPAPVQLTYLAYCSTTGLETMDYRFTDRFLDPSTRDESCYSEKSIRLNSYWCYTAPEDAPAVGPLPASSNGYVTFGSMNEFTKISPECFSLWCRLLRELPSSQLVLHAKEGTHRQKTLERAAREGIDPNRITFVGRQPRSEYFAQYNRLDIGLDPFPWTGGATTCDALWMGVPVVSLMGETAVSRGGLSILSSIGLNDLVALDAQQYLRIATDLARDLPRLAQLRSTLRQRMQPSPLMDAKRFAADVDEAYRKMWRTNP